MIADVLPLVSLADKYSLERGRIFLSGRQALVRLPLVQRQIDRRRNLNTAGFICGYRGSPLGTYDMELERARRLLDEHDIVFRPGLNEDLAATAVWGTQQLGFLPGRKVQGVFSLWYGKGPGVDRSGDPFKHANLQGTEPHGGVLLIVGDDHAGKSSTIAHQSDLALAANDIPILYPASVQEILQLGLAGIELSRFSGLLVALKIVNETADATAAIAVDASAHHFSRPEIPSPPGGVHIRKEFLAVQEQDTRLVRHKLPRALAFAQANRLDRVVFGSHHPKFLIVTAGKAYGDVMSALAVLGMDQELAVACGLAVYKVAMIYPLEPTQLRAAAAQCKEILFVEEKRPHVEAQAAGLLFNLAHRPRFSGKFDPAGVALLPADVPLDSLTVAAALVRRLYATIAALDRLAPGFASAARAVDARLARAGAISAAPMTRRPAFCPGCPHSTSTLVPPGSFAATGIGCHGMAMFHPDRNPLPVGHMGGEGAAWLGIAPFTSTGHIFQNLGDGTFNHSGSLAIRAAVQAGAHITYKILYNDAVAMTGGQAVEGAQTVERIAALALAEGVAQVVVVSEHPERFRGRDTLPAAVALHRRDDLDTVQRALRDSPGVTVLIYDQTCAAEKRRRRKRGQYPDPDRRVYINHHVCEGCGDCSVQSNCLAIQPLETDLGRKRVIDQSACNKDESCTKGFCPSFVTVERARLRRPEAELLPPLLDSLPEIVPPALQRDYDILIAGVGGTGVVTVSAVIGMAAHLESRGVCLYDMTGLSQKGGSVFSHVRLSVDPGGPPAATIPAGGADLLLACDAVAATHKDSLRVIDERRTRIVMNSDISATAQFQIDPDLPIDIKRLQAILARAAGNKTCQDLAASSIATRLLGDSIAANMIMLGFAWQRGLMPLSRAALEQAIRINAVAVEFNLRAFALGRAAATNPAQFEPGVDAAVPDIEQSTEDFATFVARRCADLKAYWNSQYADAYEDLVRLALKHETSFGLTTDAFSWAVARSAFKLMAYKDEYEVARLYTDGRFRAALNRQFESGYRLHFHFAPPLLARVDPRTGRPRKVKFGPWAGALLSFLARFKNLRETKLDLFGLTAERGMERRLRDAYLGFVRDACECPEDYTHAELVAVAQAPQMVRGFGAVKQAAAAALLARLEALRARTRASARRTRPLVEP